MKFSIPGHLNIYVILGVWLLLNLVQATCTELFHDEGLFWSYSYRLDWGYWDHAPMIGLLAKLGTLIFPGKEIGVRLFPVLMNTIMLYFIYILSDKKETMLLFAIIFSMVQSHAGGFFLAPDAPLSFFVVLFFFLYKRYLQKDTLTIGVLLALTISLLLYSKYHGAMILFFTLLSYPAILKRKSFWLIVAIVLILYIPHLNWLHQNDYATFRHHLINRSDEPYNFETTLNFLSSQILFFGPLVSLILFPAAFLYRVKTHFDRALKYSFVGVMAVLLLLSFNGHIEANWAVAAAFPCILLGYGYIRENPKWKRWLYGLAIPSIIILLAMRIIIMSEIMPTNKFMNQFSGWPEWADQIQKLANNVPVIFINGYQMPCKYAFYSGEEPSFVLNNYKYHQTQFDLWDLEEKVQGKRVMVVKRGENAGFKILSMPGTGLFSYAFIENFQSYNKILIEVLRDNLHFKAGETVNILIRLHNGYDHPIEIKRFKEYSFYYNVQYKQNGKWKDQQLIGAPIDNMVIDDFVDTEIKIKIPDKPGKYIFYLSLATDWIYKEFGANGNPLEIMVK